MANVNLLTDVHIPNDTKLTFGDSSGPDIEIYYDSDGADTGKYIVGPKAGTFYIQNETQSDVRIRCQGSSGGAFNTTLFVQQDGFSFTTDSNTTIQMDTTGLIFPNTVTAITKHHAGTNGDLPFKYKDTTTGTTTTTAELFKDKFKFHQDIELDGDLIDINGNTGTAGQVLSSLGTGNGVDWINASSGTVTGVTGAAPITSTGGNAPEIGISNATGTTVGAAAIDAGTGISVSDSNGIYTVTNSSPDTGTPAILSNGSTPSLNTGITASEVRSLIGAGTGSGTITGTGTSGRIAYWNGGSSITSDPDLLFNGSSVTIANPIFAADGDKAGPSYSFTSDVDTGMFLNAVGELALNAAGDSKLRVSSSGVGVMDDIYHVSDTDTKIAFTTNAITVTSGGTDAFDVSSGATRFQTSTRFTSNATFDNNSKAKFGDNGTLEIYNNGTDSYIDDVSTGDLRIRSNFLKIEKYTGETMADFNDDNAVRLYYNNNQRWETLSDGAGTDGDIIETISNGGGKRIGFNVGDSFTHNGNTIAHYGISNADNSTDGGIVLSGYFGLKFATNGAIRATIQNDGDTALLSTMINTGFDDNNSTTSYQNMPVGNTTTETTSSQYYNNWPCPSDGKVVSIMMMHTSSTAVSLDTGTTQLRVIRNNVAVSTSGELSASNGNNDGSYIEYTPGTTFSKGDRLRFAFSRSSSTMRWRGCSVSIRVELSDYNL